VNSAVLLHLFKELVEVDRIAGQLKRLDGLRGWKDVAEFHHLYLLLVAAKILMGHEALLQSQNFTAHHL
jgi:hypothetical protein